jgi:hypothetical protein
MIRISSTSVVTGSVVVILLDLGLAMLLILLVVVAVVDVLAVLRMVKAIVLFTFLGMILIVDFCVVVVDIVVVLVLIMDESIDGENVERVLLINFFDLVLYHCHCHQSNGPAGKYHEVTNNEFVLFVDILVFNVLVDVMPVSVD